MKPSIRRCGTLVVQVAAAALLIAGCGGDEPDTSGEGKQETRSPASSPSTAPSSKTSPSKAPSSKSPSARRTEAADGTNLKACVDGSCEVEVRAGDVIRFGDQVETSPRVTSLTVVAVNDDGPTVALSSGMTTTVYGGIEINGGLEVETVHSDGETAVLAISPVG